MLNSLNLSGVTVQAKSQEMTANLASQLAGNLTLENTVSAL